MGLLYPRVLHESTTATLKVWQGRLVDQKCMKSSRAHNTTEEANYYLCTRTLEELKGR
jgi:hypothetical protein